MRTMRALVALGIVVALGAPGASAAACQIARAKRLSIGPHMTRADLRRVRRSAALTLHPDRNPGCRMLATQAFVELSDRIDELEQERLDDLFEQPTPRRRGVPPLKAVALVGIGVVGLLTAVGTLVTVLVF